MFRRVRFSILGIAMIGPMWPCLPAQAVNSKEVEQAFANPSAEYAPAPLWVWNDLLTEQQVRESLRDLAAQKVMQVFVHPRPGLVTPYLGDEWFRLWQATLDEAEKLGMITWIYDENSYPSGFAGGFVPDQMPESRGRGLSIREVEEVPAADKDLIAVYRPEGEGFKDITAEAKAGKLPKGKYIAANVVYAQPTPWNAGKSYVDLMYPGVTEKFLEITLEPYRKHFGDQFGKRIPGSFTDEPQLRPAGALPWTPDLPERFEQKWGYKLTDQLPCLVRDVGDYKKVRHDYLCVLNQLFIERWAKPYHDYCEKNKLRFTGHYWEHDWPICLSVPDNMAMYAWHQLPAIDNLMNRYSEALHAQFGNTRTVKELTSVANQMGRTRTLCEAYGAGGWDLRFEDMKRIGDWLYVLGVNLLDPHISDISLRGARKRDHPQSFSYHTPWWEGYHISATYFSRLSAALSAGLQVNDVLLLEPTTTCWMYNRDGANEPLDKIGKSFEALIREWERNQVEYDIGSEDIIARHGSVDAKAKRFVVGRCGYGLVVIPPLTENLESKTVDLLEQFVQAGGNVISCGEPASRVDARPSERVKQLAKNPAWMQVPEQAAMALVRGRQWATGLRIMPVAAAEGQLYHHRRVLDDGELVFLVNTSIEKPSIGTITTSKAGGFEKWDLDSGKLEPMPAHALDSKKLEVKFELPPCGSLLLFLPKERREAPAVPAERTSKIAAETPLAIKRLDPNVLVLDYVDVTCQGETKKGMPTVAAGHWLFSKHGLERNPWDRAVQFKDELLGKTFPADSGFEATYRFTIEGKLPENLFAVIERPDLYKITCNGKPVKAGGDWWLDKSFGKIDITSAVRVGENVLNLKASPFTVFHELESAYIIGDFGLRPEESGFAIVPAQQLKLGPWSDQGCRLYGHRVSYSQKFNVAEKSGRYRVELGSWYGSVAKVVVNGQEAGYIGWQPWQCDVTDQIVAGSNEVEVIVFGTLRNMLGPSHSPELGIGWPGGWDNQPASGPPAGKSYTSVGYGLFEPFVLRAAAE